MKTTIKTQITFATVIFIAIFSLISCKKTEIKNPYPTPKSGSYDIKANETSGIANLMTEAEIVEALTDVTSERRVYTGGRIVAENYNASLEMEYTMDAIGKVKLSIPLTNDNGYLIMTDTGTLTKIDGTVISSVSMKSKERHLTGHITLLK